MHDKHKRIVVTPLVGVWIEISQRKDTTLMVIVTPLVGVWIEMIPPISLPCQWSNVTPLVGVWIEILQ